MLTKLIFLLLTYNGERIGKYNLLAHCHALAMLHCAFEPLCADVYNIASPC